MRSKLHAATRSLAQSLGAAALCGALALSPACSGATAPVPTVSARQAVAGGAPLIDVRTPEEFAEGHVDGAINIPVDQLGARLDEVRALVDADKTAVVYCRSGRRSAAAAKELRAGGLAVIDVGPMSAW